MPKLDRVVIRDWLEKHNWSVQRLADECSLLGEDTIPEGTMRNAVNGIDPMRPGRIWLICRVTARYGDGLSYAQLTAAHAKCRARTDDRTHPHDNGDRHHR